MNGNDRQAYDRGTPLREKITLLGAGQGYRKRE